MAVNIENTSTAMVEALSPRRVAYDSTGRAWVVLHDGANGRWEFWYSDNGTTFSEATSLRITDSYDYCVFAINTVDDRAVFGVVTGTGSTMYVATGITSSSTWTTVSGSGGFPPVTYAPYVEHGDVVTFNKPGSTNYYIASVGDNVSGATNSAALIVHEFTSAHARVGDALSETLAAQTSVIHPVVIDFRHTGDGSTVASSSPDLYVAWARDNDDGVFSNRVVWNGSGWNTPSASRAIGTTSAPPTMLSAAFDGTRFCMAFKDAAGTGIEVFERDAGDTATTSRTITALSDGTVNGLSVSYNGVGDMVIHAVGATSDDVKRTRFVRSTGTWESWTTIEATTVHDSSGSGTLSASKGWAPGEGVGVSWQVSNSGYDTYFEADFVNTDPNAPTWNNANNAAADVNEDLTLDWNHEDPDTGDAQTAFALQRTVDGGSVEWWSVAGGTWTTETKNTTATTSLTLSSWGSDGSEYVYKVKTYDVADAVSPLSDALTITASTQVNPTLTVPAASATLTVAQPTVTWTCSEQTAYQVDVHTAAQASLIYSTGKITDGTTKSITLPFSLDNGLTNIEFSITTWNTEDLQSDTDTNTGIDVTYTEPATPTYVVTAVLASGYISVAITDPTPTGSEPDVTSHDVYVRVASGGRQVGERTVNDDGIRIATGVAENGTYYDYAAPSGVDLEYRTRAIADNGTSTYGAWT